MPHARQLSRRHVLALGTACVAGGRLHARSPQPPASSAQPPSPAPLPRSLVREFVGKAHTDFGATKTLLAEHPALLNATWDWGGGDFETGLGGASHMGSRDIAEFLIGQGARMDLFTAAMLGRLDIVTPMLTAYPALLQSRGPHGLSLIHRARQGGEPARAVLDYLGRLGAS
jgi:hypothetical protein